MQLNPTLGLRTSLIFFIVMETLTCRVTQLIQHIGEKSVSHSCIISNFIKTLDINRAFLVLGTGVGGNVFKQSLGKLNFKGNETKILGERMISI